MLPKDAPLKKLFKEIIGILNSKAVYSDLLLIDESVLEISKDFSTMDISNTGEKGVKMRAFDGRKWLERFTTDLTPENLKNVARELAGRIKKVQNPMVFEDKKAEKGFSDNPRINPKRVSLSEKIKVTDKIRNYLKKQEHLKNGRARYDEEVSKRIFCSQNRYLVQENSKVTVVAIALTQDGQGHTRFCYDNSFGNGFEAAGNALKVAKEAAETAKKLTKVKKLRPGKYHCILAGRITGLLAHESFGHGMESDTVYKDRALAKHWKNRKIAADFVNILDDPSLPSKHGSIYFDDEGEIAKPTYLIKNGVVNDYITEMLTAKKLNVPRSANGRTESFDHKAYARMTNTFFAKGPHDVKDMVSKVKDGIFLFGRGGGMEDPKGWGVQIQSVFGQRITNGKLVDEYYDDIGITGYLPTILENIKQVSKTEFKMENLGHCGKGHKEWVPVSEGGPYLRIENLDLG